MCAAASQARPRSGVSRPRQTREHQRDWLQRAVVSQRIELLERGSACHHERVAGHTKMVNIPKFVNPIPAPVPLKGLLRALHLLFSHDAPQQVHTHVPFR